MFISGCYVSIKTLCLCQGTCFSLEDMRQDLKNGRNRLDSILARTGLVARLCAFLAWSRDASGKNASGCGGLMGGRHRLDRGVTQE
jgi:hypothetical protein